MRAVAHADDHTRAPPQPRRLCRRGLFAAVLLGLGGCASAPANTPSYMAIGSLPKPALSKPHANTPHVVQTTAATPAAKARPVLAPEEPVPMPEMPALRPTLSSLAHPSTTRLERSGSKAPISATKPV